MMPETLADWRRRRPNKLAAGMNYTARRQRRSLTPLAEPDPVNTLCVRGTLDTLGAGIRWYTEQVACPHCGSKQNGPRRLNDRGRRHLAIKRALRL